MFSKITVRHNKTNFAILLFLISFSLFHYIKPGLVYGLDGDFQQQKFGGVLDLIPHCDTVEKLQGFCNYCDNRSMFTKRLENSDKQVLVGNDNYIPVCRKCNTQENDMMDIAPVD